MASTWGNSWSTSWGDAWGVISSAITSAASRAHKKQKEDYQSVTWSINWQQPVIEKVENILPQEVVLPLKKQRELYRPSIYLNKLLKELELYLLQLEENILDIEDAEKKLNNLEALSKLEFKLEKLIAKQVLKEEKEEAEEIQALLLAYDNYFN